MKLHIKNINIIAISLLALPLVASCSRGGNKDVDTTKSQLFVGVYDGGFGISWAEKWGKDFEELNKETSFEEGKKGVQVHVTPNKSYAQAGAATVLKNQEDEIIFTEQTNYFDFMRNDAVLDITDWVTTALTEYGETRSIVDKMTESDVAYYQQSSAKPEYYAVPWYVSFPCISYDMKLFDDHCWYFAAEGTGDPDGFITEISAKRSCGPDGKTGVINGIDYSLDDGLPATFEEFFKLCNAIVDSSCQPFIWSGSQQDYVNNLFSQMVATIEGFDSASLNYNFNGECASLIDKLEPEITYCPKETINADNGYLLRKQAGNYYGLKLLEGIIGNEDYYSSECFQTSFSHVAAQKMFLKSCQKDKPIAMFIDGSWWYNEAKGTFDSMASIPGYSQKDRRIGILTIPQPDKTKQKDNTFMNTYTTSVVVRKNVNASKINLIKAFYRYIHTDECLSNYMVNANGIRPFKFEMKNVSKSDLPEYVNQCYNYYQNCKVVNPYSNTPIMRNFQSTIVGDYTTYAKGTSYKFIADGLHSGLTASEYFLGMQDYMTKDAWKTKYRTGYID